jgi:hypothetical protein
MSASLAPLTRNYRCSHPNRVRPANVAKVNTPRLVNNMFCKVHVTTDKETSPTREASLYEVCLTYVMF